MHSKGKEIGLIIINYYVLLSLAQNLIAKSRDIGIWATLKCNESVEILASLCFESFADGCTASEQVPAKINA